MTAPAHRRPPSPAALEHQVNDWNAKNQVGCAVIVRKDNGSTIATKTTTEAQVLSGHTAVIWVEGISGCYLLDRVWPAPAKTEAA